MAEDSLARFIAEIVSELNLDPIEDTYRRKDGRGAAGYHPELLVRLLLYGYATGITSSRRMEKATYDMVPFRPSFSIPSLRRTTPASPIRRPHQQTMRSHAVSARVRIFPYHTDEQTSHNSHTDNPAVTPCPQAKEGASQRVADCRDDRESIAKLQ